MATAEAEVVSGTGSAPLSGAQTRIVDAAVELFGEHGVGGTSLQMIADAIGVTKAAVYHQFRTKDEIVVAVAGAELARLETVVDAAEAAPNRRQAREALLTGIVDLAVERRRMESTLVGDPVINRFFARHKPYRQVLERLYRLVTGGDDDPDARVRAAMLMAAIGGAVMHPLVADLDDDTIKTHLLEFAHRALDRP